MKNARIEMSVSQFNLMQWELDWIDKNRHLYSDPFTTKARIKDRYLEDLTKRRYRNGN